MNIASMLFCLLFAGLTVNLTMPSLAEAAEIAKVKGKRLLIKLDGEPARKGDIYYIIDANGKRRGIIKVMVIKGNQAIAVLGKGKAQAGWGLQLRGKTQQATPTRSPRETHGNNNISGTAYWGMLAGGSMDTMTAKIDDNTTNMSGMGYAAGVGVDYGILEQVWFRGAFGLRMFNSESGDTYCGETSDQACNVALGYLAAEFWGRYLFQLTTFRPWLGGGFNLLFPMSKDTTAIEEDSVTNTSVMAVGGGFDYFLNERMYIPIHLEYGFFPDSNEVTANYYGFRIGLMFPF